MVLSVGAIALQNAPFPQGAGLNAEVLKQILNNNAANKYIKEEALPSVPTIKDFLNHDMLHLLVVFVSDCSTYKIDEFYLKFFRGCSGN